MNDLSCPSLAWRLMEPNSLMLTEFVAEETKEDAGVGEILNWSYFSLARPPAIKQVPAPATPAKTLELRVKPLMSEK